MFDLVQVDDVRVNTFLGVQDINVPVSWQGLLRFVTLASGEVRNNRNMVTTTRQLLDERPKHVKVAFAEMAEDSEYLQRWSGGVDKHAVIGSRTKRR